ncbi:hypothetical protein [Deinococcus soli (ex Cha et al. 2016)]|uniref:hypothetical protein n=1 Tax=Deinococcus soli (ex Cha et al. 2016) TaxID=1309411 RepID=UPI00166995D7|nr:hypothetical protein [Deinococcus soli (ex Cha et al. 2016)]GGB64611.1 hypothetical protein GCM10008019_20900 [Deinococcus soli (ex Cha et al. 2016)]
MRKSLIVLVLTPFEIFTAAAQGAVHTLSDLCSAFTRSWQRDDLAPYALADAPDPVTRLDLQRGQMPAPPGPTSRATRPQRDQRPGLWPFTLHRNDYAF